MEEQNTPLQLWLDTATRGIRFGPDRKAVAAELAGHLEDKAADLQRIFPDMTPEEVQANAVEQMGDAAELGRQLAKIHRPWLGYLWIGTKVLFGLLIVGCIWCNLIMDYGVYIGDEPWGDWDNLPRDQTGCNVVYELLDHSADLRTSQEIYTPTNNKQQLFAQMYKGQQAQVNGQTVSLLRTALWQGTRGRELFVYVRVESWRFWERGELDRHCFTVTDSLGNCYELFQQGDVRPGDNRIDQVGSGYCFAGWQLYLADVDPAAAWVRLDYGPVEPSFSFIIELGREG